MHGNLGYCKRLSLGSRVGWLCLLVLGCSSAAGVGADAASPASRNEPKRSLEEWPLERPAAQGGEEVASAPPPQAAGGAEVALLSPRHVGAAVRAHHGAFTACQALADTSSRHRDGVVTLGWLVKTDGSVADVTVGPSSFESERVNHCVLSVAKRVTFPRSSIQARVSWTVKFRGASDAPLAEAGLPSRRSR